MVDVLILLVLYGEDEFSSHLFSSFIAIFFARFFYFFYVTERPSYASQ